VPENALSVGYFMVNMQRAPNSPMPTPQAALVASCVMQLASRSDECTRRSRATSAMLPLGREQRGGLWQSA
jgi:hypothetical protein